VADEVPPARAVEFGDIDSPSAPYAELRPRGRWLHEVWLYTDPTFFPSWVGNRWGRDRAERLARRALHDHLHPREPDRIVITPEPEPDPASARALTPTCGARGHDAIEVSVYGALTRRFMCRRCPATWTEPWKEGP
jgi:hypothetical protein